MEVGILTDFINYDEAFSPCRIVRDQCKMLYRNGCYVRLFVRDGFDDKWAKSYESHEIIKIDNGEFSQKPHTDFEEDIQSIQKQIEDNLPEVILTHEMIYHSHLWKYHVAIKRIGNRIGWLHWVHSITPNKLNYSKYRNEIIQRFDNEKLVIFHQNEKVLKQENFTYQNVTTIPNPLDVRENYHPIANEIIDHLSLWDYDIIAVFPTRMDGGKQVHIIPEIFSHIKGKVKVIVVDFHSIDGSKDSYRKQIKNEFGDLVFFTSDLYNYCIPHRAVMDLFDYGDILIHPSKAESDPLILLEAAWKNCGLILNYDLPVFQLWNAQLFKFGSNVDTNTGLYGTTKVGYANRKTYMKKIAGKIQFLCSENPILANHIKIRKERSLEQIWPILEANILNVSVSYFDYKTLRGDCKRSERVL